MKFCSRPASRPCDKSLVEASTREPWTQDKRDSPRMDSRESHKMRRCRPACVNRQIQTLFKKLRPATPRRKGACDHCLLNPAVTPIFYERGPRDILIQASYPCTEINGPPVIRIDKAEVPEFSTLI